MYKNAYESSDLHKEAEFMRQAENNTTEFKRQYTEDIKKTVVAFANTNGGKIYIESTMTAP
jgi:predicted HTH transcriptional regulator